MDGIVISQISSQAGKWNKAKDASNARTPNKKWTHEENTKVLEYLKDTIQQGNVIEKPNYTTYYKRLIEVQGLKDCTPGLLRNKVRNLKTQYIAAVKWSNEAGQGVKEREGDISFENARAKRYPYFQDFQEIWAEKTSINVPYITTSHQIGDICLAVMEETGTHDELKEEDVYDIELRTDTMDSTESVPKIGPSHFGVQEDGMVTSVSRKPQTHKCKTDNASSTKAMRTNARAAYDQITKIREAVAKEKLAVQKEGIEIERLKLEINAKLDREKFEFMKEQYYEDKKVERERITSELAIKNKELEMRRLEIESQKAVRLKELEVEKLKWEVELAKHRN